MSNLKAIRDRIDSVKNTKKITEAMRLVAAAKVRRAQEQVTATRPFADLWVAKSSSYGGCRFRVTQGKGS